MALGHLLKCSNVILIRELFDESRLNENIKEMETLYVGYLFKNCS